jgi:HD-GYP domain-containing protein (c-di-GMP phosphodiesterase class II)
LTDDEFEIMKSHPQKGFKIMSQIPAMRDFLPGMYMHHEMINGEGYPQGLQGDQIPMQARIVSVADTFDAMTTERPYQRAMDFSAALTRLKSFVDTRYDARVVAAFVAACEAGKIRPGVSRVTRQQSEVPAIHPLPVVTTPDSVLAVS